jgi:Fanconi anemia group M protein
VFIEHPLIKANSLEQREYQVNIARMSKKNSTLIVLPTGLGKTVIALLVIAETLYSNKKGKILFMAPTKPLVEQHTSFIREYLKTEEDPVIFTGEVSPENRNNLWKDSQIFVSTPQVVVNDILSDRIRLSEFSLVIFDEAHRATGDYAYVFIGERYLRVPDGKTLGMTASPGSNPETIVTVYNNLNFNNVEIRNEYDPDVAPYVHDIKVKWIDVDVPEKFREILRLLRSVYDGYIKELKKHGFLRTKKPVSKTDLLDIQRQIQGRLHSGSKAPSLFNTASVVAIALKVNHALELIETQGTKALSNYLERLMIKATSKGSSKADKKLYGDRKIQAAIELARDLEIEHPKVEKVLNVVQNQLRRKPSSRIIVFTNYRDTCQLVVDRLKKVTEASPVRFVGQASRGEDKGLSQKKQVELINAFKEGTYNVLVATSVAEEGLDIPSTDLVVFYEPIPSEIRTIQRRGRTGRKRPGKMVALITKGTRDVPYYWSARGKEKRMKMELEVLRRELKGKVRVGEAGITSQDLPLRSSKKDIPTSMDTEPQRIPPVINNKDLKSIPTNDSSPTSNYPVSIRPTPRGKGQLSVFQFKSEALTKQEEKPLKITVDTREFGSQVVKELSRKGIVIEPIRLEVGDYILSDRCGVERKEAKDFLLSLMDGRLFSQAKALKTAYLRPVIVLEGEGVYTSKKMDENAIYGALASLVTDYGIPIISTKNEIETAGLLASIAKREISEGRSIGVRTDKGSMSWEEKQRFVIEGLPGVSAVLARRLLDHFGSVKAVMSASIEDLCQVKGVGKKIAEGIQELLTSPYLRKSTTENQQSDK